LEPGVLAPKGKLRFEIKEALEKTFKLTSKNGVASEAAQSQKCHLKKPETRKLALGTFPKLQEKMENRRSHLLLSCDKQGDQQFRSVGDCTKFDYWPTNQISHVMLDPERKLLGCLVEKSGSSSWHKVFWELREPSNAFVPSEAYAKNFKFAGTIGDNVWSEAMNDPTWIRFVTVRHPLARLYSGWNRNLRKGGPMAATLFSSMKLKYFAKDTADSYHVISWPDFLKFMGTATKRYPKLINTHFVPIYSKCGLCLRQYDYIIKAETSEEDAQGILSLLGKEDDSLEHRNEADGSFASNPAAVGVFYKEADENVLNNILEYYQKDMDYLGYGIDRLNWLLTF